MINIWRDTYQYEREIDNFYNLRILSIRIKREILASFDFRMGF